MGKTLYSLLLSEEVVREVDAAAHRSGLSRSALVDRVLAEYVQLTTPERRIEDIFRRLESLLAGDRELVATLPPNAASLSVKSCLQYRYRPTVRYSLELYRTYGRRLGVLNVTFRSQSVALLSVMTEFFSLWQAVETELFAERGLAAPNCDGSDGRFRREISLPTGGEYAAEEIAQAIGRYVRLFDMTMKRYLARTLPPEGVRALYLQWLAQGNICL